MLAPFFCTIANMTWSTKHTVSFFFANLFYFPTTSTQSFTGFCLVVST